MRAGHVTDNLTGARLLTLSDMSRGCGVSAENIVVLVAEGLLSPHGRRRSDWLFDANDLVRARCALRIQQDLGVNGAGAALAVELVEELQRLQRKVRFLESLAFRS
jgi:chaperone modulatory protein CbpM